MKFCLPKKPEVVCRPVHIGQFPNAVICASDDIDWKIGGYAPNPTGQKIDWRVTGHKALLCLGGFDIEDGPGGTKPVAFDGPPVTFFGPVDGTDRIAFNQNNNKLSSLKDCIPFDLDDLRPH